MDIDCHSIIGRYLQVHLWILPYLLFESAPRLMQIDLIFEIAMFTHKKDFERINYDGIINFLRPDSIRFKTGLRLNFCTNNESECRIQKYFSEGPNIISYNEQHTRAGRNIQPSTKYSNQELVEIYHLRRSQRKLGKVN